MRYIETEFTKELSELLNKYNKTFDSDKNGIYIIDKENPVYIITTEAEAASEEYRSKMIFVFSPCRVPITNNKENENNNTKSNRSA